ncbi:diguanylate cyclase [Alishewanella sp. WH16-1]|uniref:putative bifunctional diguanylate cyclase/phosphodiesterase n=1 Tax=Alishewanella sp. WH16-1 TaxID=1651088 RepID=UPI00070A3B91|nr:bifunctional diguanylate cyclase/phosphodiesterase [Alishewanella sp. WH16-1]KRS21001.1 diguanylate cyclase [Alishewanella sp. WH16-1]
MKQLDARRKKLRYYPLLGALCYLVLGFFWITFSDQLVSALVTDAATLTRYQSYKGYTYVLLTALLAWLLLKQRLHFARSLLKSEYLLEQTIARAAAGIAHVNADGQFIRVNDELCNLLGYSAAELLTMRFQQLTHPMDLSRDQELLHEVLQGRRQSYTLEKRYLHKNGQIIWARLSVALIAETENSEPFFVSVIQDISDVKLTQMKLEESELRFRTLLDSMPTISVQGYDEEGKTLYWNKGSEKVYGYSRKEAVGRNLLDLIIPEKMQDGVREAINLMASSGEARHAEELTLRRKDGSPVTVYSSHAVIILPDKKPQIYCIDIDLTDYKQQEAQLAFLAQYDPLTHLPNRHYFANQLDQALKVARRENLQLAVLILDLDNFKNINDSYGHKTGDLLLQRVVEKLQICCRETDSLARLGGDEFAILIEHLDTPEDAARFAQELLQNLQQPMLLEQDLELSTAASIGISLYPTHHDNVEALLQGADAALYKAKSEGRNTYYYYSDQLTAQARQRLVLESRLRQAIKKQQLRCYYQPQLDIKTGSIIGAELLLRWQDPELGFISPDLFIPLAESSGLIHLIGQQVLQQACIQGQAWLNEGLPPITLAVNVSVQQFGRGDLEQQVKMVLAESGFPARLLELEVTESALMLDEEKVVLTMQQLRETGVRLAIDDFGTGYSSLAYLQRLPLDILKVDRRFIANMTANTDDRQIAKAIIELGHTLRFEVLAEGVETAEQLALLQDMACDYYQGYYFSKPVPAEEFRRLLLQQQPA